MESFYSSNSNGFRILKQPFADNIVVLRRNFIQRMISVFFKKYI